jgi:hypothetical protein
VQPVNVEAQSSITTINYPAVIRVNMMQC